MIEFASSDQIIWNKDKLIIDLAHAMSQGVDRIDISTKREGPCARSLGLYDLLDVLCQRFQYPQKNIFITTCNLVEKHHIYNIIVTPQTGYLMFAQNFVAPDHKKQIVKHFGHFIGHSNLPRLSLGSYLYQHHRDRALQTYHCTITDAYHRPFIGIEDMMFHGPNWNQIDRAVKLLQDCPLTIDTIDQYPILNPTTLNITKVYPEFFAEIVNLTYWSGDTFYIDEKIWRPILMRTPFIVHGSQNFLPRLRALGFQTFGRWWDEGYGEDSPDWQLKEIVKIIDYLGSKSISELECIYQEMQSVLEHNYQIMKKLQKSDFHV